MTSLDEEIIVDVDLYKEIPCNIPKGCDNPAVWLMIRSCCGHKEFKCDHHKAFVANLIAHNILITCFYCGHRFIAPELSECYSYIGRL